MYPYGYIYDTNYNSAAWISRENRLLRRDEFARDTVRKNAHTLYGIAGPARKPAFVVAYLAAAGPFGFTNQATTKNATPHPANSGPSG